MLTLYLVRHGETDFNVSGRIQGWLDVPLNTVGVRQAQLVAARFHNRPIAAIYTSSLQRAMQTAEAIAQAHALPLRQDPRLREYNMGDWSGMTGDEVTGWLALHHGQEVANLWASREVPVPNGETAEEVRERVRDFLRDVTEQHAEGLVIAVSHGGTLGTLIAEVLGLPVSRRQPFRFSNASVTKLNYDHHRWQLVRLNDCCHLRTA